MRRIRMLYIILALLLVPCSGNADSVPETWSPSLQHSTNLLLVESGVEAPRMLELTRSMVREQMRDREIIQVQQRLLSCIRDGLPVEPLRMKVQEGLAKGISAEKISYAMERVRQRYENAYRYTMMLTDRPAQEKTIELLVAIQAAGMAEAEMVQLLTALQERSRTMQRSRQHQQLTQASLQLARDMARRGVNALVAANLVAELLTQGAMVEEVEHLGGLLMSQNRSREQVTERAQFCLRSLQQESSVSQVVGSMERINGHGATGGYVESSGRGSGAVPGGQGNSDGGGNRHGGDGSGSSSQGTGSNGGHGHGDGGGGRGTGGKAEAGGRGQGGHGGPFGR